MNRLGGDIHVFIGDEALFKRKKLIYRDRVELKSKAFTTAERSLNNSREPSKEKLDEKWSKANYTLIVTSPDKHITFDDKQ